MVALPEKHDVLKVFYMANNWTGWQVLRWLREQSVEIAGMALHPEERRRYGDELLQSAALPADRVFDASRLNEPEVRKSIAALGADIGVSVLLGYILRAEFLEQFRAGVINVHPAYLPYNRGSQPNFWSIVEGTPAGVTLHYIDPGVDTGDIIAQRETEQTPTDTGETLYHRLENDAVALFRDTWPLVAAGRAVRAPQRGTGTVHRTRDRLKIDEIDPDKLYRGRELIDILRAGTFPPYRGAYFRVGDKRVFLRLQLEAEEL